MRVLFTTQPGTGHWRPLAPIAIALQGAGHDVAFATMPWFCQHIAAHGFVCFPMGTDDSGEVPGASSPSGAEAIWGQLFAGTRARHCLPDLLDICRDWRPDLIVRETSELAGCVVAEAVGIPHAAVQVSAFRPRLHDVIAKPLSALREEFQLPPDLDLTMLDRYLLLTPAPPDYWDPVTPYPVTTHPYYGSRFDYAGEPPVPEWFTALQQPIIFATLGTAYNSTPGAPGVFEAIIDAFRGSPVSLVLATGVDRDPAPFGDLPDHIHVERYIPQSLAFATCDLVITHGGFGTVMTAIDHGLPMIIVPIAADQPDNARRCTALGIAKVITPDDRVPSTFQQSASTVLRDTGYRNRARDLQRAMHELPGLDTVVALLERLAHEHSPLVRSPP